MRHDFLNAFVNALQPVFLVGSALTLIAFVLALFLKEVPLRGTNQAVTELAVEEAAAGASPADELIETTSPRR